MLAGSVSRERLARRATVPGVKEPSVGDIVDARYVLRREIARGAMGIVFEATHVYTDRTVALKLLHAEHADSEPLRQRLLREGRALGNVRHVGIVEVRDAGIGREDEPFVAMEMLEGRSLDGILAARRTLPVEDVVRLGLEICSALAVIHAKRFVHRDIKPSNLFIALDASGHEVTKLIDFGIASLQASMDAPTVRKLTLHGELLGTPEYMAPEQLLGLPVDHRVDLYALGVTLYECLTGDVPFSGTYPQILIKVQTLDPAPLRSLRSDTPPELAEVIERAISRDPEDRFPSARAFAAAIEDAAQLDRSRSLPPLGKATTWSDVPTHRGPLETALLGLAQASAKTEAANPADGARDVPPARARHLPAPTPLLATRAEMAVPLHRRRYPRAPYVTPVSILRATGESLAGRSEDVSETGLLVITPGLCDDGESVRVRFALPGQGGVVTVHAKVRWTRSARDGRGTFGLEFELLPEAVRQLIADYVRTMGGWSR